MRRREIPLRKTMGRIHRGGTLNEGGRSKNWRRGLHTHTCTTHVCTMGIQNIQEIVSSCVGVTRKGEIYCRELLGNYTPQKLISSMEIVMQGTHCTGHMYVYMWQVVPEQSDAYRGYKRVGLTLQSVTSWYHVYQVQDYDRKTTCTEGKLPTDAYMQHYIMVAAPLHVQ